MHMKISSKVVITSLALLTGAALAGSVSGTIAWFQYATRAQVAYTGTTSHCSKVLRISAKNGTTWGPWGNNIVLSAPDALYAPITTGAQAKNAALTSKNNSSSPFYAQPNPRQGLYRDWKKVSVNQFDTASSYVVGDIVSKLDTNDVIHYYECIQNTTNESVEDGNYWQEIDEYSESADYDVSDLVVKNDNLLYRYEEKWLTASESFYGQFNLIVKVNDVDTTSPQLTNDVYLTDVTIEDAVNGLDLSNAIRVHVATTWTEGEQENHKYFLFAKNTESTKVGGYLDLDNDGAIDKNGYEWDQSNHLYGGGTVNEQGEITSYLEQTSYLTSDTDIIAREKEKGELFGGTSIGQTSATTGSYLHVTITVWLEGWALLKDAETGNADANTGSSSSSNNNSSSSQNSKARVWKSASYANKDFHVGITFGVKLHSDDDHPTTTTNP